jgi:hypothetical protein
MPDIRNKQTQNRNVLESVYNRRYLKIGKMKGETISDTGDKTSKEVTETCRNDR